MVPSGTAGQNILCIFCVVTAAFPGVRVDNGARGTMAHQARPVPEAGRYSFRQ